MSTVETNKMVGGDDWTLIKKADFAGGYLHVPTFDESSTGTWQDYKLAFTGWAPDTDGVALYGRIGIGPEDEVIFANYAFAQAMQFSNIGTNATSDSTSATVYTLATGLGNDDVGSYRETYAYIFDVSTSTTYRCGRHHGVVWDINDPAARHYGAWRVTGTTSGVVSSIRLYPSTGAFDAKGEWRLYGRKAV